MKKLISQFRIEPDGYFIDLVEQDGKIGVDPQTGSIYLDEGYGPDRFHGAVIRASEFRDLTLHRSDDQQSVHVMLRFGERQGHDLGETEDVESATTWTFEVARAIQNFLGGRFPREERLATTEK